MVFLNFCQISFKILQITVSLAISASHSEFTKLRTIHKSVQLLISNLSVRAPLFAYSTELSLKAV